MLFLKAFLMGFSVTLGVEVALGLCMALGRTTKGATKNE